MSNSSKYGEIFDYLSSPAMPVEPEAVVVFGRNDPLVAHKAGELAAAGLAGVIIITGGVGKDSGDILQQGFRSEAHYLGEQLMADAREHDYMLPVVFYEEEAAHGGQNAEFSVQALITADEYSNPLTAVAHATSSLRLAKTLEFKADSITGVRPVVHRAPSSYGFDADNPTDQIEAAQELLRLADWPAEKKLYAQPDLPLNLVDFARDMHGNAPKQPSKLMTAGFNMLPKKLRVRAAQFASRK